MEERSRSRARLIVDDMLEDLADEFSSELGMPLFYVKDTGKSIDVIFNNPSISTISIGYTDSEFTVPPDNDDMFLSMDKED